MINLEKTLNYIAPEDTVFTLSENGLLELCYKGENCGRVAVLRMFPFMYEEEYISIRIENYQRYDKENEIGILRSLSELSNEQAELLRDELKKRYFIPEITEIYEVKEEPGNTSWKVNTTAGKTEFTITDMGTNIRNLGNNRIMLTDVYGNRYYIIDITKADDKAVKILEIWI